MSFYTHAHTRAHTHVMQLNRALMEAQEIFGLEFDPNEFARVADEGLGSEEEEEEDDVRLHTLPVHVHCTSYIVYLCSVYMYNLFACA